MKQGYMRLPGVAQDIADVIGRERALYLIGQLPRCTVTDKRPGKGGRSARIICYVPKALKPDHYLVRILGWQDAEKLAHAFSGELLCPPNLNDIVREFRNQAIANIRARGDVPVPMVMEWFGVSRSHIEHTPANPQEDCKTPANDNAACFLQARDTA